MIPAFVTITENVVEIVRLLGGGQATTFYHVADTETLIDRLHAVEQMSFELHCMCCRHCREQEQR